mmetsp:Transcript_16463/g.27212  ORF Transcript_16463/g.27212 Transcript_16463/m.27212 type:complete len:308 (-) Transcript_16463:137-1060(-)
MMQRVSPGKWHELRTTMCRSLNKNKTPRTLEILRTEYGQNDIIFIQEASSAFVLAASRDDHISAEYHVVSPARMDPKRDQNSLIFLRRRSFKFHSMREITEIVKEELSKNGEKVPVSDGDIFAIRALDNFGRKYILASFHGDTNGLATIPVVSAVDKSVMKMEGRHRLIFGLDANTYERGSRKRQDMNEFVQHYRYLGIRSCWGGRPKANNYTTYNARTYLQPQLNKASKKSEFVEKGDRNPKDFILFYKGDFQEFGTTKDNTGNKKYIEDMVFPTLAFPSDHAVLSTTLAILKDDDRQDDGDDDDE